MNVFNVRMGVAAAIAVGAITVHPAQAQQALGSYSGDLIVSSSTYSAPNISIGSALPNSGGVSAVAGSAFCANANCSVNVWNNDTPDANFGITSNIYMSDVNTSTGTVDNTVNVTGLAAAAGINLVNSFSSKSELAINLTPDGQSITFMGYNATAGQLDISNSNTPGSTETGNTDTATATYRAIGQLSLTNNALSVTLTNAYSGNNGRAAIAVGNGQYYTVGNAGNGNGDGNIASLNGVQYITSNGNGVLGTNQVVGQFNCNAAYPGTCKSTDKIPKDNNYRGETIYDNTLYVSKGSGSNGINTVYQVGSAGTLPAASPSTLISVLNGFTTTGNNTYSTNAKTTGVDLTSHPFGIWFASSTVAYVADEGSGVSTDFGTNPTTQAGGLEKWVNVGGTWSMEYELKGSLIGSSYTVNGTGALAGDSLTTTTDGLRNLTGVVNADGTVTLYAVTSTEGSVLGDAGADPNEVVKITDSLASTTGTGENFTVLDQAALGQVYRGVAVAPVPLPATAWLLLAGLGCLGVLSRRRAV